MALSNQPLLTKVEVYGLFGHFDHQISFPPDWDFVIIHGVNGVGKTMVLDLIKCLTTGDIYRLAQIPFHAATLTFEDKTKLEVERVRTEEPVRSRDADREGNLGLRLEFSLSEPGKRAHKGVVDNTIFEPRTREMLEQLTPLWATDPDAFMDPTRGDRISTQEALERYRHMLPARLREQAEVTRALPAAISKYWQSANVYLIETQRLLSSDQSPAEPRRARAERPPERMPTVMRFSQDVASRIQKALSELGQRSQELDRTFPSRLVKPATRGGTPDESDVRRRYNDQLKLRRRLTTISVLDAFGADLPLPREQLDPVVLRVMTEFLTDSEEKFKVVEPLLDRLELLTRVLNKKFQYKRVTVDRRRGFVVLTQDDHTLSPDQLSSGEQHELVLLYDLLFGAKDEALVLIDEPEISLHVNWQKTFLSDLREVSALARHRFLVATHSPNIIGRFSDRMVRLEGGERR